MRRTPALAGIAPEDVFATIDTTQGWLSNGISKPMTINGGIGDDNFIVFHNLDTLDLNGDAGNDNFLVQAFALAGSQEDHRALTDLSGGAGADLIQYAVNAPVNIDGGDGFDTVTVIGTEFNDDFVITSTGVFGAGLNVNFVNVEALIVDGGAGDDRFFVLSAGANFTTEIDGGLGSDLVSVLGPTPANGVISNDLLGHSGIITQSSRARSQRPRITDSRSSASRRTSPTTNAGHRRHQDGRRFGGHPIDQRQLQHHGRHRGLVRRRADAATGSRCHRQRQHHSAARARAAHLGR